MCQGKKKVLIVEDDATICEALKELFGAEGFMAETAGNGAEALEHLRTSTEPCLVLLDMRMPVMSGPEFVKEIRKHERFQDLPVIILTGDDQVSDQMEGLQVQETLRKPVDIQILFNLANQYC